MVDLFVTPTRPSVDKDVNFTLEIKSKANDVLIELPVATYFLKDGKPVYSNPNNYTLVRQQHYDFGYKFNELGVYSLALDIKIFSIHLMLPVSHSKLLWKDQYLTESQSRSEIIIMYLSFLS